MKLRGVVLPPEMYRVLVIEAFRGGLIDRWDAWRELFNLGWRGKALNDFLR